MKRKRGRMALKSRDAREKIEALVQCSQSRALAALAINDAAAAAEWEAIAERWRGWLR